jgi:hypothetical protein
MKVSTFRLHTRGLALDVVQTIKVVIAYAEQHKERHTHCMALSEFCRLVGFPIETTQAQIVKVMSRADKATASLRIVEVSLPRKNLLLAGSWPVFDYIVITHAQISFEICPRMWTWKSLLERV